MWHYNSERDCMEWIPSYILDEIIENCLKQN